MPSTRKGAAVEEEASDLPSRRNSLRRGYGERADRGVPENARHDDHRRTADAGRLLHPARREGIADSLAAPSRLSRGDPPAGREALVGKGRERESRGGPARLALARRMERRSPECAARRRPAGASGARRSADLLASLGESSPRGHSSSGAIRGHARRRDPPGGAFGSAPRRRRPEPAVREPLVRPVARAAASPELGRPDPRPPAVDP